MTHTACSPFNYRVGSFSHRVLVRRPAEDTVAARKLVARSVRTAVTA
ncbi:hypothetical protein [Hymenobacter terrestris]|uniref:Uncharacterized protein n=1 Tax=Hymenobacter terrestris TaxID=2748310 RepID=A0ABX2Q6L3_9BACT|nr:hypothetical protein [Hymenobacter terrestris]NVO86600.1 hypothetical protein [Hymenobacter terrestris]